MHIDFDHVVSSSLDAERLWTLLVESFEDSTTSPIWPNDLETLRCEALESGATVDATYHVGPFDAPQTYEIPEFDAERHFFEYRTGSSHPLEGGGRVEIEAHPSGSRLCWSGSYRLRRPLLGLAAAAFIKGWFERRFFEELEANIRGCELS